MPPSFSMSSLLSVVTGVLPNHRKHPNKEGSQLVTQLSSSALVCAAPASVAMRMWVAGVVPSDSTMVCRGSSKVPPAGVTMERPSGSVSDGAVIEFFSSSRLNPLSMTKPPPH